MPILKYIVNQILLENSNMKIRNYVLAST